MKDSNMKLGRNKRLEMDLTQRDFIQTLLGTSRLLGFERK